MDSVEVKMSSKQKEVLVEFMEAHEAFAKGQLLGAEGRKKKNELWAQLTATVNSCSGPVKTEMKWQRVWVDLKNKTKKKAAEIAKQRVATGRGPESHIRLTHIEEKILNLLTSAEAVHGLPLDSTEPPISTPAEGPTREGKSEVITVQIESPEGTLDQEEPVEYWHVATPSTPGKSILSEEETAPGDTTPTPSPAKRLKRESTTAGQAAESFKLNDRIGQVVAEFSGLNRRIDRVITVLEDLASERRTTNSLLQELLAAIKHKRL